MSLQCFILWEQVTRIFPAAIILSFFFTEEYTLKIKQVIDIAPLPYSGKETDFIRMSSINNEGFFFLCTTAY